MKTLTLGLNADTNNPFTIPVQGAATKTLGIFGKKGSGKTWTAAVWVEQLLTHQVPVVILDPVGRWWDLGLSADGRSAGFPIAILGGQHGQVPLAPDMGTAIARYVADKHVATVVDLSFESKNTWRKIIADFCDELFKINRLPVHVIIEEAPEFIPQRIFGENATVFGAVDRLVRLGRNHGIGVTAIGQRLQTTNKDTVSQVDALIVMRLVDPQGKKSARDWVLAKGEEERADEFVDALARLKTGAGFVWSPEWLEEFAQVNFAPRQTFHYDADRAAEESMPTGAIAQAVDTNELIASFARFTAPIGAKPDGRSVKHEAKIADLERQIESLSAALETAQAQAVSEEDVEHRIQIAVHDAASELRSRLAQFEGYVSNVVKQGQALVNGSESRDTVTEVYFAPMNKVKRMEQQVEENPRISRTAKKIFRTLVAEYPDFPNGMSKAKLAMLCKLKVTSGGGFNQPLADLRARRYITFSGAGENALVAINAEMLR